MLRSPGGRAAAVVAALAGLLALAVWFGSLGPAPALGAYPGGTDLGSDYDRYVGQRVVVAGDAVSTDPLAIEVDDADGDPVRYEVVGLEGSVEEGDGVWVFGVAEPGHVVRVENAVVTPPWRSRYMYGVSFLSGLWVLARIVRDWRYDPDVVGLAPRGATGPADGTDAETEVGDA